MFSPVLRNEGRGPRVYFDPPSTLSHNLLCIKWVRLPANRLDETLPIASDYESRTWRLKFDITVVILHAIV